MICARFGVKRAWGGKVTTAVVQPLLKPSRRGGATVGVLAWGRAMSWRGWGGAPARPVGGGGRQRPAIGGHGWAACLSAGQGRDGAPIGGTPA
jgi:hypothetical protein